MLEVIISSVDEHCSQIQKDQSLDQKLNKAINTLELSNSLKRLGVGEKLELLVEEILRIKSEHVLQRKNF